ncbi:MAG: hypothetical protein FD124_2269 [Alphaproteobacteria bacterium]|nr:MAG: hypothetical protein FD160_2727 [Caulobacteraceae bacterium]TPW05204.1 MAG: hypothetical protein FD124_2269 [Alphaproteobacteria bacterium]
MIAIASRFVQVFTTSTIVDRQAGEPTAAAGFPAFASYLGEPAPSRDALAAPADGSACFCADVAASARDEALRDTEVCVDAPPQSVGAVGEAVTLYVRDIAQAPDIALAKAPDAPDRPTALMDHPPPSLAIALRAEGAPEAAAPDGLRTEGPSVLTAERSSHTDEPSGAQFPGAPAACGPDGTAFADDLSGFTARTAGSLVPAIRSAPQAAHVAGQPLPALSADRFGEFGLVGGRAIMAKGGGARVSERGGDAEAITASRVAVSPMCERAPSALDGPTSTMSGERETPSQLAGQIAERALRNSETPTALMPFSTVSPRSAAPAARLQGDTRAGALAQRLARLFESASAATAVPFTLSRGENGALTVFVHACAPHDPDSERLRRDIAAVLHDLGEHGARVAFSPSVARIWRRAHGEANG